MKTLPRIAISSFFMSSHRTLKLRSAIRGNTVVIIAISYFKKVSTLFRHGQRDMVKFLVGEGIQQEHICRAILNPQTGKPLSPKTLRRAFAIEIKTGTVKLNFRVGKFVIDTILGRTPDCGQPIKDDMARVRLVIFFAECQWGG
jgi:hypothetical protein